MKFLLALVMLVSIGCGFTLPASRTVVTRGDDGTTVETQESLTYSELCVEAVRERNAWNATSIIFNALGTATAGAVVTSEFLTDEEWVPAAFSIGGLVFGGIGIGAGLVRDAADEDVLRYCGSEL